MSNEDDKILGIEGLARYLNLSKSTVYKLAQEGALPGQKVGKHWRFRQKSVNNWLDSDLPLSKDHQNKVLDKTPSNPKQQNSELSVVSPFKNIFTPEQIALLHERWIETADQLLSMASTPTGSAGLRKILNLSEEDFSNKLKKLYATQGLTGNLNKFSAIRGGEFGLRVDKIHTLEKKLRNEEES